VAKSLNSDLQAVLFRCIRELMLNTVKHAKARSLTVAIGRTDETIFFTVADDGIGFGATAFSASGSTWPRSAGPVGSSPGPDRGPASR
jgi:signal transduction histidine kinase